MERDVRSVCDLKRKKGVMNQIINIFVLILVISVLAGMTFLFVSQLKEQVEDTTATTSGLSHNESGWLNLSGYKVANASKIGFRNFVITDMWNASGDLKILAVNYTYTQDGMVYNATTVGDTWQEAVNISYTFTYVGADDEKAYLAVNTTETAGHNVTKYLTILFLALIFGAILVVVLRVILPYINVGQQMGGF